MKTLAELKEEAKSRTDTRFLILHKDYGARNGRFLDPYLGVVVLDDLPDVCVRVADLDPFRTTGVFLYP